MLRDESERLANDPEGRAEIKRVRDYVNGRNEYLEVSTVSRDEKAPNLSSRVRGLLGAETSPIGRQLDHRSFTSAENSADVMALMVGVHCFALTTNSPQGSCTYRCQVSSPMAASSQVVSPEGPASIKCVVQLSEDKVFVRDCRDVVHRGKPWPHFLLLPVRSSVSPARSGYEPWVGVGAATVDASSAMALRQCAPSMRVPLLSSAGTTRTEMYSFVLGTGTPRSTAIFRW